MRIGNEKEYHYPPLPVRLRHRLFTTMPEFLPKTQDDDKLYDRNQWMQYHKQDDVDLLIGKSDDIRHHIHDAHAPVK